MIAEQDVLGDNIFGVASHELKEINVLLPLSIVILIRQHHNLLKGQLAWLGHLYNLQSRPAMQFIMFTSETTIKSKGHF